MESLLQDFVFTQITTYVLVFCRVGTVMMLMPGVGDSFIPPNIRLLMAVAFTAILSPAAEGYLPEMANNQIFVWLIITEILTGFFIGTIARIFMAALDTAGMLIGMNVGLGSAMIFNPQMAGQGSAIGAFLSIIGAVLLFTTDLHHMLIYGMMNSYQTFPVGAEILNMAGGMAATVSRAVSDSFAIGFYMALPFMVVSLFLYIAMGVLGRLMPQIQVFVLALPLQIMLGLVVFIMCISTMMLFWLNHYDQAIQVFFQKIG